jgi:queuine tRNA-ribosyltransferase
MARLGGLHRFMNWDKPILTDSGGFQVMSLGSLVKITEEGVSFQSHIDGSKHFVSPERSIEIQRLLGSDIVMAFDECTRHPATHEEAARSMRLSMRWAKRSREAFEQNPAPALFGIQQGSLYPDLRRESAGRLIEIGFEGYAIGGLAVGEGQQAMFEALDYAPELLPDEKPRYLMGVGKPSDIIGAVLRGVDMFDCVLPRRHARNGQLFTMQGIVRIRNSVNRANLAPNETDCPCHACHDGSSLAFLHHLERNGDPLWVQLATAHNVSFYMRLLAMIREAIGAGTLDRLYHQCLGRLDAPAPVAY